MRNLLLSLSLLGACTAPLSASASGLVQTPEGFCRGTRFDGAEYGQWIDANAINLVALKAGNPYVFNDPALRELYRRQVAKTWKGEVSKGQTAKCGKATL